MRKLWLISTLLTILTACEVKDHGVDNKKDQDGCVSSAGFYYSFLKKECVRPSKVADIYVEDPLNSHWIIYVVLSEDKSQAELFSEHLPQGTILDVVKGGYLSKDNRIRLMKRIDGWEIYL